MKSDVEVLEIENPKELDALPSEISLHVEDLKLEDDVKRLWLQTLVKIRMH